MSYAELAKHRLVYIKRANEELEKKNDGKEYNQALLASCNRVLDRLKFLLEEKKPVTEDKKAV